MIKHVRLYDLATVERSKAGKVYPAGTCWVQISATKGQNGICLEQSEIPTHCVAIIPDESKVIPQYLAYAIEEFCPEFCARYQTGLNIVADEFKHFELYVDDDMTVQADTVKKLKQVEDFIAFEEAKCDFWQTFKKWSMTKMFV